MFGAWRMLCSYFLRRFFHHDLQSNSPTTNSLRSRANREGQNNPSNCHRAYGVPPSFVSVSSLKESHKIGRLLTSVWFSYCCIWNWLPSFCEDLNSAHSSYCLCLRVKILRVTLSPDQTFELHLSERLQCVLPSSGARSGIAPAPGTLAFYSITRVRYDQLPFAPHTRE